MPDAAPHALPGVIKLDPEETSLGLQREGAIVVIPVFGSHDLFVACLHSVLQNTGTEVPVFVADDASPDPATETFLDDLVRSGVLAHCIYYRRNIRNLGFVENVNSALSATAPADVVLLNSDCEVGPKWVDLLHAAAYSDSTIATASAITNHGTLLSVPHRNQPTSALPVHLGTESIAVAVAEKSLKLRPRIPTAIGHCVYFKRSALDLVGAFDVAFSPGYGEEVDFSQRCILRGLSHVAADDVFVFHHGHGSFGDSHASSSHRAHNEEILRDRYPYYHQEVAIAELRAAGPLSRALASARMAIDGLSVTIDARCLGPVITGTQMHVIELIHGLARAGTVRMRILVPREMNQWFRDSLSMLDTVEVVEAGEFGTDVRPTSVVHRPYQIFHPSELEELGRLGERLVVTHQDFIAYRNPGYFHSFREWNEFRALTRLTLAVADYVLFFSHHAAREAIEEDLIDPSRARVAHLGVDHQAARTRPDPRRPSALPQSVDSAGFLLCLGTNFRHKNRAFALRVFEALQRRHAWNGYLVFAGPHATVGTSAGEESAFLALHPTVSARTLDLKAVSEDEKAWLLASSRGVIFPSTYEGFGLVPFEAAREGVPCFFAGTTALTELLPEKAATIAQWDPDVTADEIFPILRETHAARDLVDLVEVAASELTWDRTAQEVVRTYELTVDSPYRDAVSLAETSASPATVASNMMITELGDLNVPADVLVAFRAFAARPRLRRPFFSTLRMAHRAGYLLKRRRWKLP